jgi:hypothetical protein
MPIIVNKITNEKVNVGFVPNKRKLIALYGEDWVNWVEVSEELKDKLIKWDESQNEFIEDTEKELKTLREEAHKVNREKHIEFQQTPTLIEVLRDDGIALNLVLNCDDNTTFNVERALSTARLTGDAPFYGALGEGHDKRWSEAELIQVINAMQSRLKPSFDKKGMYKDSINNATSKEELENIIDSINSEEWT